MNLQSSIIVFVFFLQAPLTGGTECNEFWTYNAAQGKCEPCDLWWIRERSALLERHNLTDDQATLLVCDSCQPGSISHCGCFIPPDSSCQLCEQGKYSYSPGSSQCQDCEAGHFQDRKGERHCLACAVGMYQPDVGKSRCLQCPEGKTTCDFGSKALSDCTPFSNVPCPIDFFPVSYWTFVREVFKKPGMCSKFFPDDGFQDASCSISSHQMSVKAMVASAMAFGFTGRERGENSDSTARTSVKWPSLLPSPHRIAHNLLTVAFISTSLSTLASAEAATCSPGSWQIGTGSAASCAPCDPGSFSSSAGQTLCSYCDPGRYQNKKSSTACNLCPRGRTSLSRYAACDFCSQGRFMATVGSSHCTSCPRGRYADYMGASQCSWCSPGKFSLWSGAARGGCKDPREMTPRELNMIDNNVVNAQVHEASQEAYDIIDTNNDSVLSKEEFTAGVIASLELCKTFES